MLKVATVIPHEPYREYKDVERVYSGSTEIDKILDKNGNVLFAVNKEVEGTPALTYKGKEETNLKNYRIYGNTAGGESVGDLETAGEHAGEYKVPVTVGGKNLLQNTETSKTINGVTFTVNSDGSIVCDGQASPSTAVLNFSNFLVPSGTYILAGCPNGGSERKTYKMLLFINGAWFANDIGSGANFTLTKTSTVSVRIDVYNGYTCDNLTFYPMFRKADIEDDTYEPYHAPVTTPIYLPEPIKMVGDEAEYLDYGEQKMHRVRKNLLNDKLSLNATLGTLSSEPPILGFPQSIGENRRTYFLTVAPGEQYTISMSTPGDRLGICGYYNIVDPHEYTMENKLISDVVISPIVMTSVPSTYTFTVPNNVVMVAIYYSLSTKPIQIQIEKGSTATPYEPYIENTDLDVTLPALPILSGTNTLSVVTEVQPSNVYLKGRIKEVP